MNTRLELPAFSPSGTSVCTLINIVDDTVLESRESFFISLSNLNSGAITINEGENIATILILDNDCKLHILSFIRHAK